MLPVYYYVVSRYNNDILLLLGYKEVVVLDTDADKGSTDDGNTTGGSTPKPCTHSCMTCMVYATMGRSL